MKRLAGWIGVVGGIAWLGLAWVPAECVPVTGASEVFCNRLWTPALLGMLIAALAWLLSVWAQVRQVGRVGASIIAIGYGLLVVGNGGEYWLAYRLPHEGPDGWLRSLLWMTALGGWLAVLVGSTTVGAAALRGPLGPRWLGAAMLLTIPLTAGLAYLGYPAATLGIVGIVVGVLGITNAGARSGRRLETAASA